MKRLIILRHAVAAWDYDDFNDFNRPLKVEGEKGALLIGEFIKSKNIEPCIIMSSEAKRAYKTAEIVAEAVNYPLEKISTSKDLYLAWSPDILRMLQYIPEEIETCIIVGHNPGLTDLINDFGVRLDYLPTSSAACFEFNTKKWNNISRKNAELKWFQQSKDLK